MTYRQMLGTLVVEPEEDTADVKHKTCLPNGSGTQNSVSTCVGEEE